MAENESEKDQVQTGAEPGSAEPVKTPEKSAPKNGGKKGEKKGDQKPKKPKGKTFEENKIRDSDTAKERGRNGGVKSGEVRRAKRDARESVQYLLGRMTKSEAIRTNLKELGVEESEYSNMIALHGRLFSMAMSGNLEAYLTLMRMGGYEPEETRKERESIAADRRRELELDAKVAALNRGDPASVALNMQDEDGDNDVVIYMPQMDSEEDCEPKDDPPAAEGSAE